MNKKMLKMAVLIEFLAGSGLAIFFHQVLRYPEAAYTIFGIGVLLSLVTYLLREDIEKTRAELLEQYHQAHELTFAIARISDPECQSKAHELMASAMRSISLLQKGYVPLDETEYYQVNRIRFAPVGWQKSVELLQALLREFRHFPTQVNKGVGGHHPRSAG